jgi:type I restriction enzyme S subunit
MSWEKVKLGDIATVTSSKRFHLSERSESGIPFYCSKQIIQKVRGELVSDYDYIREEFYENVKKQYGVPEPGDLLITTRGSYGVPYIYQEDDKFYFADGNLTWLKDFKEDVDVRFLYYWIRSYEGQKKIDAIAKGTAQKAVTIDGIKNLEISIPSFKTQKRIADILSAYDDLIENNQKQIKLLEEAVQRLYKQWFIDLRYPGNETTPIVDGIPQGWRKDRADSFFNITIGKTPPRAEKQWFTEDGNGIPWISISDMGADSAFLFETSEGLTLEAIKRHNVKVVPANTVLLSFKLTVGRVSITSTEMCTNEAIAHFVTNDDSLREYTYCYLKNFHYDELGSTSSISKAINSKIVKAMPFVMPSDDTVKAFHKVMKPIFDQIFTKQKQIKNLSQSRDRLLPKLMNGELEV